MWWSSNNIGHCYFKEGRHFESQGTKGIALDMWRQTKENMDSQYELSILWNKLDMLKVS